MLGCSIEYLRYALNKQLGQDLTNQIILKTTEHLRMMGVFYSIELRMLRRADYVVKEPKLLRDSHVHSHERQSVHKLGWGIGWAHSLLSLAFATRWNRKHPSYVNIRLFLKFHLADPALLQRADYIYMKCFKA